MGKYGKFTFLRKIWELLDGAAIDAREFAAEVTVDVTEVLDATDWAVDTIVASSKGFVILLWKKQSKNWLQIGFIPEQNWQILIKTAIISKMLPLGIK